MTAFWSCSIVFWGTKILLRCIFQLNSVEALLSFAFLNHTFSFLWIWRRPSRGSDRQASVRGAMLPCRTLLAKTGSRASLSLTCSPRDNQISCSTHTAILHNWWAVQTSQLYMKKVLTSCIIHLFLCVCVFLCEPIQNLTWLSFHLTISHHMPGSRCLPPTSCVSWVSTPQYCSTPAVCTAPTSAAAHSRSSLWTAAHATPPPPAPTTVSPVIR